MSSTYWWLVEWTKTSVFSFHILYCNNSDMFSNMQNLHRNKSVFLPLPQQSHSKTPGYCWAFVFLLLEASAAQVYNMRSVSIIPIVYCIANSKVAWMCFHPAGKHKARSDLAFSDHVLYQVVWLSPQNLNYFLIFALKVFVQIDFLTSFQPFGINGFHLAGRSILKKPMNVRVCSI